MLHTLIKHDLKALQAFVAIVECHGVSAAQDRLNMSQSAISTHLAHLEESLGTSLCKRGRAGFSLTKAGHQLYEACTLLLQATNEFHREVQNIKWHRSVLSGLLRVGLVDQLPKKVQLALEQVIRNAYQHYPELRLSLDICTPEEIEIKVATNQLDIGIGNYQVIQKNLYYESLFDERHFLYAHANHPANKIENITLNQLEEDFAWVKQSYTHMNQGCLLKTGVTTATAFKKEATLLFILSGHHIGYLPEEIAQTYVNDHMLIPLLPQQTAYLLSYFTVSRTTPEARVNWFLGQLNSCLAK